MILNQTYKPRCREFKGPTPHATALRARPPLSRLAKDHLLLEWRKQEDARDQVLDFTKDQQMCDLRTNWQKHTDRRIIAGTIERRVQDALDQHQIGIEERRERLRSLLETEEKELLEEIENKKETVLERQARMRDRARTLRERRESERQQLVADKLDQQFREQSEELRATQSKRTQDQVCAERALQLRSQEERRQQAEEESLFQELWEADRRAKEARENEEALGRRRSNEEQVETLRAQREESERQREQRRRLKEEEATLLREQREMLALSKQREQLQKHQAQEARRRQLDRDLRLKMRRLGRQRQDELALDMSILQQLQEHGHDQGHDASRKSELRLEQQRYRQHLADELERQRREEAEFERLMEAELQEKWRRQEEKSRVEREARGRLMHDVMATRRLQIQHKLNVNTEKQQQLSEEKEELNQAIQEMKTLDEEQRRSQRQVCQQYQADLLAQMRQREQQALEQRAWERVEQQQGLEVQNQHSKRIQEVLSSRPHSDTMARRGQHPSRRPRSVPGQLALERPSGIGGGGGEDGSLIIG